MGLLTKLYGRLKLRVNEAKSAVALATAGRSGLLVLGRPGRQGQSPGGPQGHGRDEGTGQGNHQNETEDGASSDVITELRAYLLGWKEYFRLADTPNVFRKLDEWIRHRLRAVLLKQWKRGRTIYRELRARGVSELSATIVAANARRWWKNSAMYLNAALPNRYFDGLGLPRLGA